MGPGNKLSCETGNISRRHNPNWFLQPEVLRLSFPVLESWVSLSFLLPSCSSQFICMQIWDRPVLQPPPCHMSSPSQLPVSVSPTSLDECFFFNSFGFGLPYNSTFWQFWFFVFKIICCPSFDCARRQSVSTDASILDSHVFFT